MPQPFPDFDDDEFEQDEWCAYDDAFDIDVGDEAEESFTFEEDYSAYSQDVSCATDKSPVDVRGFPAPGHQRSRRGGKSSSGLEQRIGQDVQVGRGEGRGASTKNSSASRKTANSMRSNRIPRKSKSMESGTRMAVAALASCQTTRTGVSRSSSDAEDRMAAARNRRLSAHVRGDLPPETDDKVAARRKGRRPTGTAASVGGGDLEEKRERSANKRSSSRRSLPDKSLLDDKTQRAKELAAAYQAANILGKGIQTKAEHLKKEVL